MVTRFAEESDWDERGSSYTKPTDIDRLLDRASELIDFITRGRAETLYSDGSALQKQALIAATVDQVEYWVEVSEAHDVTGLRGTLIAGRVQVQHLPGMLGQRAQRQLLYGGILYSGVGIMG